MYMHTYTIVSLRMRVAHPSTVIQRSCNGPRNNIKHSECNSHFDHRQRNGSRHLSETRG